MTHMKRPHFGLIAIFTLILCSCSQIVAEQTAVQPSRNMTLKDAYADKFLVGATLGAAMFTTPNHPSLALEEKTLAPFRQTSKDKYGIPR